jgi:hypothetical protein
MMNWLQPLEPDAHFAIQAMLSLTVGPELSLQLLNHSPTAATAPIRKNRMQPPKLAGMLATPFGRRQLLVGAGLEYKSAVILEGRDGNRQHGGACTKALAEHSDGALGQCLRQIGAQVFFGLQAHAQA